MRIAGNQKPWLLLGVLLCGGIAAAQDDVVDPPDRVARLSFVGGSVSLAPADADEWVEAVLNRPLTSGDRVWVDSGARAELEVGAATIHLDENTGFSFVALDDDVLQGHLTDGGMALHVRSLGEHETIRIDTPNATVMLRQPGEYAIDTEDDGDRTIVKTRSGEAEVYGSDQHGYIIGANEQGIFTGDEELSSVMTQPGKRSAFELWAYEREQRAVSPVASNYVAPGVVGYRDLDAYGTWSNEPEYGAVWQPTMYVFNDWAPYRYGRWVWVSPWGWTWVDDAPWGFAPFHYGRWTYLRRRWCWVPGPAHERPVYAPALVGWAGYPGLPSYERIGWFPLGPRDVYMPGYRTTWRYFSNANVSNAGMIDSAFISNAYYGRGGRVDYRNFDAPGAVTVMDRDAFVSAHRTSERRINVDPDDLQRWQHQGRPPAIDPNHDSVLGARPSRHSPPPHQDRQHDRYVAQQPAAEPTAAQPPVAQPRSVQPQTPQGVSPRSSPAGTTRQWTGSNIGDRTSRFGRAPVAPPALAPSDDAEAFVPQSPDETQERAEPTDGAGASMPPPTVIRPPTHRDTQSHAQRNRPPQATNPPSVDQTPNAPPVVHHPNREARHDRPQQTPPPSPQVPESAPQRPMPSEPAHRDRVQAAQPPVQPAPSARVEQSPRGVENNANARTGAPAHHGQSRTAPAESGTPVAPGGDGSRSPSPGSQWH